MKQIELEGELEEAYKDQLAQRYGLKRDDLIQITVEGVKKGWPY
jgi:hypothetical protein